MKFRIIVPIVLLFLLAGPVLGQATYSFNASANEVTALTADITAWNTAVCEAQGITCSAPWTGAQSAARAALCVRNGLPSNCTYAQGRAAWCDRNTTRKKAPCTGMPAVVIATTAEELFVARASATLDALRASQREAAAGSDCAAWRAASDAARNNACSALGRANGCDLCPN